MDTVRKVVTDKVVTDKVVTKVVVCRVAEAILTVAACAEWEEEALMDKVVMIMETHPVVLMETRVGEMAVAIVAARVQETMKVVPAVADVQAPLHHTEAIVIMKAITEVAAAGATAVHHADVIAMMTMMISIKTADVDAAVIMEAIGN